MEGMVYSGTAEIRAKIGHKHWPKSRGFGHATFNAEKRRLSSPFDHNGQRGFWPGQKEKGIANHETNKAIIPLCPKITCISAIPGCQFQKLMRLYRSGCDWLQKSVRLEVGQWLGVSSPFITVSLPLNANTDWTVCRIVSSVLPKERHWTDDLKCLVLRLNRAEWRSTTTLVRAPRLGWHPTPGQREQRQVAASCSRYPKEYGST